MFQVHHLLSDEYTATPEDRALVSEIVQETEPLIRAELPGLPLSMNLLLEPGMAVIQEVGFGAFTMSPNTIKWTHALDRSLSAVAVEHLHASLFHECHHATRLARYPEEAYVRDWQAGALFEGLATVFERDAGGSAPMWGEYEEETISQWAEELFAQPVDHTFNEWKFAHPDGRRWIAYRVGTWVVDRAVERSGRSAAAMVWETVPAILEAAGMSTH